MDLRHPLRRTVSGAVSTRRGTDANALEIPLSAFMRRLIILLAALLAVVALGVLMYLPTHERPRTQMLPWSIALDGSGGSTVFGLALGRSTVADAERIFGLPPEWSLFRSAHGRLAVEAYFDRVTPGDLLGKLVLEVAQSQSQLQAAFNRGLRVASLPDGSHRVTLHPDDIARVRQAPIASITYLPAVALDGAIVRKRFGTPARKVAEAGGTAVHWLYPKLGLDVTLRKKGGDVLQYVAPRDFQRLQAPLSK